MELIRFVLNDSHYREKFLYAFVAVAIAAAFLMNFVSLPALLEGKILFVETLVPQNVLFLLSFSFLTALALVMHLYKKEMLAQVKVGKESIGAAGALLGLFTSACSICYPLVLTALGIPTAFAILPLGGAEIQIASILLLLISIYLISRECQNCKIKSHL